MTSDEIKKNPDETPDTDELLAPSLDEINDNVEPTDEPTDEPTTAELEEDIVRENTHDVEEQQLPEQQASQQDKVGLFDKLKNNAKTVVLAVVGTISAAAVPIWQTYFVETADVSIELSSISRIESPNFTVALDTDELFLLVPYIADENLYEYNHQGVRGDKIDYPTFSMDILDQAYDKAKQDLKNISVTKSMLQKNIEHIASYLDPSNLQFNLSEFRVSELKKWDLSNHIDDAEAVYYEEQVLKITRSYSKMEFVEDIGPHIKLDSLEYLLGDVKEDITDVIFSNDSRLEVLRDNIRSIETQLAKIRQEQLRFKTYFTVSVMASNAGRVSTSLRPLALMRVQISDENYVDIRLRMDHYKDNSEIPASSTNIIHYRSRDLYTFPAEDQESINTFWGSTGRVRLFSLDTKERVFISNQIAFVDNLNQKVMIDKLKEAATRNMN